MPAKFRIDHTFLDTKGPEIRTTTCDNPIELKKGTRIKITGDPDRITTGGNICQYSGFSSDVPLGSRVLIDDGDIELKVIHHRGNTVECSVENDILGPEKRQHPRRKDMPAFS